MKLRVRFCRSGVDPSVLRSVVSRGCSHCCSVGRVGKQGLWLRYPVIQVGMWDLLVCGCDLQQIFSLFVEL